ncbi:MAG: HAMP domain-containing protein [Gammaproteobacteria bacterium]|nr:HAMP domain-containing protein [Gammaproteobacteria bacterium]
MEKITARFLIGEKIGFGFGFVGLLFLGVIWQYHGTLQSTLEDYQRLQNLFEAKESRAHEIMEDILGARVAEKEFLLQRDERSANAVEEKIGKAFAGIAKLGQIDQESALTAEQLSKFLQTYQSDFQAVVRAWKTMGLNHDLGLQGAFRDAVHELESMAGQHKVGALYLQLLQIRRSEKDLGLRREDQYHSRVQKLVQEFQEKVLATDLQEAVKRQLLSEATAYRDAFEDYALIALRGGDIAGGKGLFRDVAHRIEALLNQHYVPDLEASILQLRRREKDYLLRGDKRYVDMAIAELQNLHNRVEESKIPDEDKQNFRRLLDNYQRDFLALVDQNDQIELLTEEMEKTVSKISALTQNNVDIANQAAAEAVSEINFRSQRNERLMLWVVAIAALLGIFLAVAITRHISRPLRKMAGILDRLAYEDPTERMPVVAKGRDEVNAMALSVNTMADHRDRFIRWWQLSMQEAEACQRLEQVLREGTGDQLHQGELAEAEKELLAAIEARYQLAHNQYQEVHNLSGTIINEAEKLAVERSAGEREISLDTIRHSAKSIQSFLEIVSYQEERKDPVAPT